MLLVPPSEAPVCVCFFKIWVTQWCFVALSHWSSPTLQAHSCSASFSANGGGKKNTTKTEKAPCSLTLKHGRPANLDISMPVFPKSVALHEVATCLKVSRCWRALPNWIQQARRGFVFFPLDSSPVRYTCSGVLLIKRESWLVFRNWCKLVCFAHFLSKKLNLHGIPRALWSTHLHVVLGFNGQLHQQQDC